MNVLLKLSCSLYSMNVYFHIYNKDLWFLFSSFHNLFEVKCTISVDCILYTIKFKHCIWLWFHIWVLFVSCRSYCRNVLNLLCLLLSFCTLYLIIWLSSASFVTKCCRFGQYRIVDLVWYACHACNFSSYLAFAERTRTE